MRCTTSGADPGRIEDPSCITVKEIIAILAKTLSRPLSCGGAARGARLAARVWRVVLLALSASLMLALAAGDAFAAQLPGHSAQNRCGLARAPAPMPVPPITARPRTKRWEYQYAVAERIWFGLSATRRSIAAAAADPFSTSEDLGTPLTPAEHRQLLAEDRFGLHVEAVLRAAQIALASSFAGAWFEYPHGIYVAFTSHACPSQRLRSRLARIAGGRTVAVAAAGDATALRLNDLARAVDRDTTKLRHLGVLINRTEIDTPGDRFPVTLDPASVPRSRTIMRARYGARARSAPPVQALDARNATADVRSDTTGARKHTPEKKVPASLSRAPGAPFLIQAHALARGDFALSCAQFANVLLLRYAQGLGLARTRALCVGALRSARRDLSQAQLHRLASTRIVGVRVHRGRARVTVQTTLYGLHPLATGTAIREDGGWRILKPPSGAYVGSSLVKTIPSGGMIPTLRVGDTILVDRDAYRHAAPAIGDIVVFHPPVSGVTGTGCATPPPAGEACATVDRRESKASFVKRIVAGPGDRVSIRGGHVIRNGIPASESFIAPCDAQATGCDFPRTLTVPAGAYYVLGDNRGASDDSRFWGPITRDSIIGRVRRLGP